MILQGINGQASKGSLEKVAAAFGMIRGGIMGGKAFELRFDFIIALEF